MIDIVSNKDHLNDSDMTEVVGRVKILLINSKKEKGRQNDKKVVK